jgi:hypothetical protein
MVHTTTLCGQNIVLYVTFSGMYSNHRALKDQGRCQCIDHRASNGRMDDEL